ncbi:MAG: hypothetical protein ACRED5_08525 [Propylenella sp.]
MHDIKALIAKSDTLAAVVRQFKSAALCPLVQGFSLLPITDEFAAELSLGRPKSSLIPAKPLPELSDELHALAIEISQSTPVAYASTFYFGGQGRQDALVWDGGGLQFSPATNGYDGNWPDSSISQALRAIGVVPEAGMDAFDTAGLGRHRETSRWAESTKPRD